MIIGGQAVSADEGGWIPVLNPATSEAFAEVPYGGIRDVDMAVRAARAAFTGELSSGRAEQMLQLAAALKARAEEIIGLDVACLGKAVKSARGEFYQGLAELKFYAALAAEGHQPEHVPTRDGFVATIDRVPLGVAALIVPWNYPFMLMMRKLAAALAAGCTVIIKPATATPLSALVVGQIAAEIFPPGTVNVITGPGNELGRVLVERPGVDKISFTGSTENGRLVLRGAAGHLQRVSLELGGKNPFTILPGADLNLVIPDVVWAGFYSAGQSCDARSVVWVHTSAYDDALQGIVEATRALVVGDPTDEATHIGTLVSPAHRSTVLGFISEAREEGLQVVVGGTPPVSSHLSRGCYLMPTVVTGTLALSRRSSAALAEIFGPVVLVLPYNTIDEVVAWTNNNRYGLAATLYGPAEDAHDIAKRLRVGTVTINQPLTVLPGTPFGGFRQSGWGREAGRSALLEYTEERCVIEGTSGKPGNFFGLPV